jgi:hypothetical protein
MTNSPNQQQLLEQVDEAIGVYLQRAIAGNFYDVLLDANGGEKAAVQIATLIESLRRMRKDLIDSDQPQTGTPQVSTLKLSEIRKHTGRTA